MGNPYFLMGSGHHSGGNDFPSDPWACRFDSFKNYSFNIHSLGNNLSDKDRMFSRKVCHSHTCG